MKRLLSYTIIAAAFAATALSCETGDIIGGSVNDTAPLKVDTYQALYDIEDTRVVAELFDRAGLKETVNGDVTVIAPNRWSVNRYLRRKNSTNHKPAEEDEFTLESMDAAELSKMGMYIFPGQWWRETIPEEGQYLTSVDGTQEILLTLDPTNSDPGTAYDGGGAAGYGYQYSNFMMSKPYLIHVLFKRGENWELDYLQRTAMSSGLDNPDCDQYYRMFVSDVRTSTGVFHVLYSGDISFNEHYYYHSLFFFGTRADDR